MCVHYHENSAPSTTTAAAAEEAPAKNKTFKLQILFLRKLFRICKFIARLINVYKMYEKSDEEICVRNGVSFSLLLLLLLFGMKNYVF